MDELTKRDDDLRVATENDLRRHRLLELQCKVHKIPDVDVTDSLGFQPEGSRWRPGVPAE